MLSTKRYDSLFKWYGQEHGVDWLLLKAQAMVESGLNPMARSPKGAQGLAQFMPATWAEWGHGSPDNPEAAIEAQAKYMAWLLCKVGSVLDALAAYNFGIGHVRRKDAWPKETGDYVARVTRLRETLESLT